MESGFVRRVPMWNPIHTRSLEDCVSIGIRGVHIHILSFYFSSFFHFESAWNNGVYNLSSSALAGGPVGAKSFNVCCLFHLFFFERRKSRRKCAWNYNRVDVFIKEEEGKGNRRLSGREREDAGCIAAPLPRVAHLKKSEKPPKRLLRLWLWRVFSSSLSFKIRWRVVAHMFFNTKR